MKAIIDEETCTGCGQCEETCPEVFEIDGDVARIIADPVPGDAEFDCRSAADECPDEAIIIEEDY